MPRTKPRYVLFFFLCVMSFSILFGGFNLLIDPFGIYRVLEIEGLNTEKPVAYKHARLHKTFALARLRPSGLILGSLRAQRGLDPAHPGWKTSPVYNVGLVSSTIFELHDYLVFAQEIHPLKQVVVALDLFNFNVNWRRPAEADSRRVKDYGSVPWLIFRLRDLVNTLLTYDALISSLVTIAWQNEGCRSLIGLDGMVSSRDKECAVTQLGHRRLFQLIEWKFLNVWRIYSNFELRDEKSGRSTLEVVTNMVADARRWGIDLRFIISPVHARQLEVLRRAGVWLQFEDWKRELVAILAADAARHPDGQDFPLWDFSGYNSITRATVPAADQTEARLWSYWEGSHFTKAVGDMVLDRVLVHESRERSIPQDFGVRLGSANIDVHLRNIRAAGEQYRNAHSDDLREIEIIASGQHLARDGGIAGEDDLMKVWGPD